MIKKISLYISALLTILLIVVPRFYELDSTPHGLHIDEVSFAADAKAIAETGRDTWNVPYPRVFQAFGEWKAPGLTYSMAFWAKAFGEMNSWVARLPSAIAGLVSIIMLVLTIHTLAPRTSPYLLMATALILAYSPWHFDMSRIFYEAFSAMAWISVSLYFATRQILKVKDLRVYEWYAFITTAGIAGYYYASLRYVIIAYVIVVALLTSTSLVRSVRLTLASLAVLTLVSIGWVGDLFSPVGLNRLYYYQQKSDFGAGLEIDEKRQYCYLALDRDASLAKGCYALWNKPAEKLTGALTTVMTYLGTDFLFIRGESEYGFDSEYGAYLTPIILLYIVGLLSGLVYVVRYLKSLLSSTPSTPNERVFALYFVLILLSLVPAAIALNLNIRMSMVSLYVIAILIGWGLIVTTDWLSRYTKAWMRTTLAVAYILCLGFYITQSTIHYWFVFTKSNDLQWTSDAGPIFNYVKSVSADYDRIVDTELHGPLAPYFYGDITTAEVHNGTRSKPDDIGFTYLIKAGKYELKHINIKDLACEVVSQGDTRRTLVITNPYPELLSMRKYESRSWNGALLLHEVYDLSDVIAYMERSEPGFRARCTPQ